MATQAQYEAAQAAITGDVNTVIANILAQAGLMSGVVQEKISENQTVITAFEAKAAKDAVDAALGATP